MGLNPGAKRDRHVKYLYTGAVYGGQKDSAESNLKFDNALLRADAYSPGSRELRCGSADAEHRITPYVLPYITLQVLPVRVWSCVLFAIARPAM